MGLDPEIKLGPLRRTGRRGSRRGCQLVLQLLNRGSKRLVVESQLVPLLLGKPSLHAVVWNHLCDSEPHEFPHSGLLDPAGRAKPLLAVLQRLRQELLA